MLRIRLKGNDFEKTIELSNGMNSLSLDDLTHLRIGYEEDVYRTIVSDGTTVVDQGDGGKSIYALELIVGNYHLEAFYHLTGNRFDKMKQIEAIDTRMDSVLTGKANEKPSNWFKRIVKTVFDPGIGIKGIQDTSSSDVSLVNQNELTRRLGLVFKSFNETNPLYVIVRSKKSFFEKDRRVLRDILVECPISFPVVYSITGIELSRNGIEPKRHKRNTKVTKPFKLKQFLKNERASLFFMCFFSAMTSFVLPFAMAMFETAENAFGSLLLVLAILGLGMCFFVLISGPEGYTDKGNELWVSTLFAIASLVGGVISLSGEFILRTFLDEGPLSLVINWSFLNLIPTICLVVASFLIIQRRHRRQ